MADTNDTLPAPAHQDTAPREPWTPGYWSIQDARIRQEGWAVGSDHDFPGRPGTTHRRYVAQYLLTEADAHLVSAAKELYEALKHTRDVVASLDPDLAGTLATADAALDKARGKFCND